MLSLLTSVLLMIQAMLIAVMLYELIFERDAA